MLDYPYLKKNYKMIAIDLCKQHVLDDDPRTIQQITFAANLVRAGSTTFSFLKKQKTALDFSQGTVKVL